MRLAFIPAVPNALGQAAFTWAYYNVDAATATFALRLQIVFLAVGAYLLFPSERALLRRPQAWAGIALVLGGVMGTILLRNPSQEVHTVSGEAHAALGVITATASGLLFACYALAVRKYMHGMPSLTAFAAVSQYTTLISLAIMFALARDPLTHQMDFGMSVWRLSADNLAIMGISALIGIAIGHTFYFISIARLGVAVTSGVIQLQPFCVAIFQWTLYGIILTAGQWASGTLAVCGAMLMLHVQWTMSRARAPVGAVERERVAGDEPVGIEAAEMDAMPVDGQLTDSRSASRAGKSHRHAK
jgi:drug/metabolite transporter (DMT)-like permease